ncbi:citrate lyase holo-[acyl-carrier protein] synthase [Fusibacter sp. JL216-2]|uniref:citrate lyase holo-[acyl-carrier protein] synthase n=1 Tax=Fusibacter sp. JL216-2 TaxID=3071453 RepID=UPI003D33526B
MVSTEKALKILKARENRSKKYKQFNEIYQGTILALTMNIPGAYKKTKSALKAFDEGLKSMNKLLSSRRVNVLKHETSITDDGPEACWVIDTPPISLKSWAVELEETHPLGRLFDFDVLNEDLRPLHRENTGGLPRRCFICNEPAHMCARSQKHDYKDLHKKIDKMVDAYYSSDQNKSPWEVTTHA